MNYSIILLFSLLFTGIMAQNQCTINKGCPEPETCCARSNGSNKCQPLGLEGDRCGVTIAKEGAEIVYKVRCPCATGLTCEEGRCTTNNV